MKIYTQLIDEELDALSSVGGVGRRWTANAEDIVGGGIVSATVEEHHIDFIRTRQARDDGGWSKEVCLFPGAKLADIAAA